MNRITLSSALTRGMAFIREEAFLSLDNFFGMTCSHDNLYPETTGMFFLDADIGRFDGRKLKAVSVEQEGNTLRCVWSANDILFVHIAATLDEKTGVISIATQLENRDTADHIIYSCMNRFPVQGAEYQVYSQYAAWCAENQGAWSKIHAGNLVLTNSAGCSTESATPFACLRHTPTGRAVALHVIPKGDWMIRARHIAGHRTSYTVLEAGLSDASLRLNIAAGAILPLPEILLCGFSGEAENCAEMLQRYLIGRYDRKQICELVYNTWFFDFDVLETDRLEEQVRVAKEIGCKTFVVDAGWFGQGVDWENQVGNWNECTSRAFCGKLRQFSDYVRSQGMGMGLWMEPARACVGTKIYEEHPEFFMPSDTIIYDLANPAVVDYLADELTKLVKAYDLVWMKLDYNSNMLRDITGSNFYYYFEGERKLLEEIRRRNPGCSFEGCAGGGRRTDIENFLANYHGFFVSDTVNPVEVLRIRQGTAVRLLPSFMGSWIVLHECKFTRGSYTSHNRHTRTKVFSSGDATWDTALDVDLNFALSVNLLGEFGISGDISSLSAESLEIIKKAAAFYEAHRGFMAKAVCHPLTAATHLDDIRGWAAMQYENLEGQGSLLFTFRLVDDAVSMYVYPKNLDENTRYQMVVDGEEIDVRTGQDLMCNGICVTLDLRYRAQIMELKPLS